MASDAFLKINKLDKNFGKLRVLKDINLTAVEGEFLVFVGPSGCGKSTLLNCIAGLEEVTSGDIFLDGKRVNDVHPSRRNIAMVFQSYALYPNMTVAKNISFGMEMRKVPKDERDKAVGEVAKTLQIESLLDRKPQALSGGQRQRVAMGRALVRNPQMFLFDEPLSNLDAKLRVEMRGEIKRLHETLGATIAYVTHDQVEAMTLADKIVVLKEGVIQQVGSPDEIYSRPGNLFVADFMGSPPMNLIDAVVKGSYAVVGDVRLKLPSGSAIQGLEGKEVILGLRPEYIGPAGEGGGAEKGAKGSGKTETVKLKAVSVDNYGADLYVFVEFGGGRICTRAKAGTKIVSGQTIDLLFRMGRAVLFDKESGTLLS